MQQGSADHHPAIVSINSVKGIKFLETDPFPGKERRVSPDHHPSTVCIRIWNVRTLNDPDQLENVKQEMSRLNVNILGVCESQWSSNGDLVSDKPRIIYAGGEKNEKGVGLILRLRHEEMHSGILSVI